MEAVKNCTNCYHSKDVSFSSCETCNALSDVYDPYPNWEPIEMYDNSFQRVLAEADGSFTANVREELDKLPVYDEPIDIVNKPPHYRNHPSGVECIQITEHMNFCLGNAMKYIWRAGDKHETPIEDLKKAKWYIEREIARLEKE